MKKIVVTMIILFIMSCLNKEVIVNADSYTIGNPRVSNGYTTWDCIYFGNYYQSSKEYKEPIKWRVLSVNNNEAFLLSDKIIDVYELGNEYLSGDVTWETSGIRKWLNNDFYNSAFSDIEKESIIKTYLENKDFDWNMFGSSYHTDGGNNTYDNVFNLSLEEVNNKAYGFVSNDPDDNIFYSDTRYAEETVYVSESAIIDNLWWLRTPGVNYLPCVINEEAPRYIWFSQGDDFGVRPAIKIELNNNNWKKTGSVTASHDYVEHRTKNSEEDTLLNPETKNDEQTTSNNSNENINKSNNIISTQMKKITAKKKSLKITWKKVNSVTGYKLQYSLNKNFKGAKIITIKKASSTSKIIKKLKHKTKYYVRIRTYITSKGKPVYSAWSKTKSKKTK